MKTSFFIYGVLVGFAAYPTHAQPGNYVQFGKSVFDASAPIKLTYLQGTIRSVKNGIVTVDIYKYEAHALPARGSAGIGAYSAGGSGYSEKAFDRTVAITNFTDSNSATINKEVTVQAMQVGTFAAPNGPLELYDCGVRYIPPPLTPEQKTQSGGSSQKQRTAKSGRNAVLASII
jgi:hypothetical protein